MSNIHLGSVVMSHSNLFWLTWANRKAIKNILKNHLKQVKKKIYPGDPEWLWRSRSWKPWAGRWDGPRVWIGPIFFSALALFVVSQVQPLLTDFYFLGSRGSSKRRNISPRLCVMLSVRTKRSGVKAGGQEQWLLCVKGESLKNCHTRGGWYSWPWEVTCQ